MTDLPALEEKIPALIATARPRRLLTVGSLADALASPGLDDATDHVALTAANAGGRLAEHGKQDMAIIAGELQALDQREAARLLSQLRDIYAAWVIVVTDRDQPPVGLSRHDMVGLGFSLLGDAVYAGTPVHVYEFDIATYKVTPDWLNSRYWANPEMWDRYRW